MKEVIQLPDRQYPQTETKYTCGRCKQPSGDSEETRSSYDVVDTTIELRSGQKIELSIGKGKPAELTIDHAVPDILEFVVARRAVLMVARQLPDVFRNTDALS
jgi:hypothetical protein